MITKSLVPTRWTTKLFRSVLLTVLSIPGMFAGAVTWNLNNVTFAAGGTATGSFTIDGSSLLAVDITTTTGPTGTGFHYTLSGFSYSTGSVPARLYFNNVDASVNVSPAYYGQTFSLWLNAPALPSNGGSVGLYALGDSGFERRDLYSPGQTNVYFRNILSGSLDGVPAGVPEPGTTGLVLVSLIPLAGFTRRRRPAGWWHGKSGCSV